MLMWSLVQCLLSAEMLSSPQNGPESAATLQHCHHQARADDNKSCTGNGGWVLHAAFDDGAGQLEGSRKAVLYALPHPAAVCHLLIDHLHI